MKEIKLFQCSFCKANCSNQEQCQADESQWQYHYKLFDAIASTMEDRYAE